MEKNNKIIFMGTPLFAANALQSLIDLKYNIIAVVSQPNNCKKKINYIKNITDKYNIPLMQPIKINSIKKEIVDLKPDFIITCAYGQFLSQTILNIPKLAINIHASLLPKLRGGAPIHWAIINREKTTGVSIIKMTSKMDAGPIYAISEIKISDTDTMITLHNKLMELTKRILSQKLTNIFNGNIKPINQDESQITFGLNITRKDEKINFNNSTDNIIAKIKGLYSWPIAYSLLNNKIHKFYFAKTRNFKNLDESKKQNGEIVDLDNKGIHIKVTNGCLIIEKIQIAGKKPQDTFNYYKSAPKGIYIGGKYE